MTTGPRVSATVTLNVRVTVKPESVAEHETVVVPSGKVVVRTGVHAGVSAAPVDLVAVTVGLAWAPVGPVASTVRFAGTFRVGTAGVVPVRFTVTGNEALDCLPRVSRAVQATVVTPNRKPLPDAGVH